MKFTTLLRRVRGIYVGSQKDLPRIFPKGWVRYGGKKCRRFWLAAAIPSIRNENTVWYQRQRHPGESSLRLSHGRWDVRPTEKLLVRNRRAPDNARAVRAPDHPDSVNKLADSRSSWLNSLHRCAASPLSCNCILYTPFLSSLTPLNELNATSYKAEGWWRVPHCLCAVLQPRIIHCR